MLDLCAITRRSTDVLGGLIYQSLRPKGSGSHQKTTRIDSRPGFSSLLATRCIDWLRHCLNVRRMTSVDRDKIAMAIMGGLALIALLVSIAIGSMAKWG